MVELELQHHTEAKKNLPTINRLNETADKQLSENTKLKQDMNWLLDCVEDDDIIVARKDEAVEHLGSAQNRKIRNKQQVSYSFPSCPEYGEFKQNFKGRWLS
jgi:hypothetical protein